jgi:hypothetical protein
MERGNPVRRYWLGPEAAPLALRLLTVAVVVATAVVSGALGAPVGLILLLVFSVVVVAHSACLAAARGRVGR